MSKFLWVTVLFLVLAETMLPGQSIAVTSPKEGETFRFGQVCVIAWTKSGAIPDTVAIRLRRSGAANSEPAVLEIAGSTANDGSFSWPVPAALAAGSYFVRVKAPGSASGDSKAFTVAAAGLASQNQPGSPVQPKGLPPGTSTQPFTGELKTVDFQMVDVERETGSGALYARLRNNGNHRYSGPLTFLVFFNSRQLDPITLPLALPAGSEQRINLTYSLSPLELAASAPVQLLVSANGDSKVRETSEANNAAHRVIQKTCPVYIKNFWIEVDPAHSTGPYPIKPKLLVHLDAIGQGDLEILYQDPKYFDGHFSSETLSVSSSGNHVFEIPLSPILESWVTAEGYKEKNILAKVKRPHPDQGVQESNVVHARWEYRP